MNEGLRDQYRNIRNFVVISHIDHGKSTLADRFLEITGTVEKRKMREQFLDMHPLEREKGITIKMTPVRMVYRQKIQSANIKMQNDSLKLENNLPGADTKIFNFDFYILNLIDTPGHVDFSYEVSRALAAVEGAILLVDATQGIQAQTLANLHLAQKEGLTIIPAINKIDLPSSEIKKTEEELSTLLGIKPTEIFKISAKTGTGVEELLRGVVAKTPAPILKEGPLRALIFDSFYDSYQGVIAHIRIFGGGLQKGDKLHFLATRSGGDALEVGVFLPERTAVDKLQAGEIGYVATGIKEPERVRVGDTITRNIDMSKYRVEPLSGYQDPEPMVFASIFPENQDDYLVLRESLRKLKLNDAAFTFEPEESGALGRGVRAGFLGMLHMEIISERLRREYGLRLVFTTPSVAFRVTLGGGDKKLVHSALAMPERHGLETVEEPLVACEIITPAQYLGVLNALIAEHAGKIVETATLGEGRLVVKLEAPLREIIVDFYDQLKSISQGFASMSYEVSGYQEAELVRLDILVAGEKQPALSELVPKEKVYLLGRKRAEKLKELLPRELFAVAIQAEAEGRIIARETIPALRKDVTGYLYGGDRTRKMKLWSRQQRGKKRLKERGRVEIPAEVFLKFFKK